MRTGGAVKLRAEVLRCVLISCGAFDVAARFIDLAPGDDVQPTVVTSGKSTSY